MNRLTGYPDGKPFSLAPGNGIETHGPYQHGDGWPAVNGVYNDLDPFDPDTPPQVLAWFLCLFLADFL